MPKQNSTADIVSSQSSGIPAPKPPALLTRPDAATEFELLCACCHPDGDLLQAILSREVQWDRVFRLAGFHRLLPAVCTALAGQPNVPAAVQSALHAKYAGHCRRVLRFTAELARILQKFEASGIPAIAHKGPVLSQQLYGDAALREFGDLDFLVRAGDLAAARTALLELGYESKLQLTPRQEKEYLRSGYEHVFGCGQEKNLVELQWQIVPRHYAIVFDMDAIFNRCVSERLQSFSTRVLCSEDLLLVLCVHAAKHNWTHLGMVRDIGTLAVRPLDWEPALRDAQKLGIKRIVFISLLLARDLLGFTLPAGLSAGSALRDCQQLAVCVAANLRHAREIDPESAEYFLSMLRIRERWSDRARFLTSLALTPSVGEWKTVDLPDPLFSSYKAVRAYRLIKRLRHGRSAQLLRKSSLSAATENS